tara:strand:+ start:147 stop:422 length:276 start_codon:yes stop_codon:yes gene_type:complete
VKPRISPHFGTYEVPHEIWSFGSMQSLGHEQNLQWLQSLQSFTIEEALVIQLFILKDRIIKYPEINPALTKPSLCTCEAQRPVKLAGYDMS